MNAVDDSIGFECRSRIGAEGRLTLSLLQVPTPEPKAGQVVVRVDAAPINPSDIGLLFGAADMTTLAASGSGTARLVTASVPPAGLRAMARRVDQSLPVGNEGAGIVVRAGSSDAAQALLGRAVAMIGGAMYAQYRCVDVADCLCLPSDTTPVEGASAFVNPLTSLGMIETMKREGHTALVHTAAASNLGQMLNRLCLQDGIGLVNIVRSEDQQNLLRGMGALQVCNSTAPTFMDDLAAAIHATGATLAFDAIGGGTIAGQILTCMEASINQHSTTYSRYGSSVHKQVYIYGGLDLGPTQITRSFGMAWGIGGWLVFPFLRTIGPDAVQTLRERIGRELKTTFASRYTREISLDEMLEPELIAKYSKASTGEKFLLRPNRAMKGH